MPGCFFEVVILSKSTQNKLTGGHVLARNTLLNFASQSAPMLVAILTIPILVKGLGIDRFGLLTLSWTVIGYFSLFDMGLGRALTQLLAQKLGAGEEQEIPSLVWTAIFLMLVLGLLGAIIVGLLSPWLVRDVLKIPEALRSETILTFYLLSLSMPIIISSAGFAGILEAQQRFGLVSIVRVLMGTFTFLGPLLVLPFSQNLPSVIVALIIGRTLALIILFLLCIHATPILRQAIALKWSEIRPLLRFGGWMTISNIISPIMVYLDRFLIGALVSMAAVAYYTTPYEVVTKLWIIPGALTGVLFPAFTASFVQDQRRTMVLFERGVKYIFLLLFPITLLIVSFAHETMDLWLDSGFARNSTIILQLLAIGVFINSLARIPYTLIQGIGRPDITAKLHLIELVVYLPLLWWATSVSGIKGTALAWVIRAAIDTLLLFGIAQRFFKYNPSTAMRTTWITGSAIIILSIFIFPMSIISRGTLLALALFIYLLVTWRLILSVEEKSLMLRQLKIAHNPQ